MKVFGFFFLSIVCVATMAACTRVKFTHYDPRLSTSQYEADEAECRKEAKEVTAADPDSWAIDILDTEGKKEDRLIRCMDRKGYTIQYKSIPW
ncbi:hypothetical protein [Desulfovibrio inopinatus]|uniref:hypothetical protein n=1 Tax=Desulfovibrio inopinatus TaxID=102109 RepID=UPI0003F9E617|nr:hypothetical protein [Desulfovibrio inopinatus]